MGTVLWCRVVACNLEIKVASHEYKGKKTVCRGHSKDPHVIAEVEKKFWQSWSHRKSVKGVELKA